MAIPIKLGVYQFSVQLGSGSPIFHKNCKSDGTVLTHTEAPLLILKLQ